MLGEIFGIGSTIYSTYAQNQAQKEAEIEREKTAARLALHQKLISDKGAIQRVGVTGVETPDVFAGKNAPILQTAKDGGPVPVNLRALRGGTLNNVAPGVFVAKGKSHKKGGIKGDTNMDGVADLEFEGGEGYIEFGKGGGFIVSKKVFKEGGSIPKGNTAVDRFTRNRMIGNLIQRNQEEKDKKTIKAFKKMRARAMRDESMPGTNSTHLMADWDGGKYVTPTIFPNEDGTWTTYEQGDQGAFDEAMSRGEVFEFRNPKKGQAFARGSWKKGKDMNRYKLGGYLPRYQTGGPLQQNPTMGPPRYTPPAVRDPRTIQPERSQYVADSIGLAERYPYIDPKHAFRNPNFWNELKASEYWKYKGAKEKAVYDSIRSKYPDPESEADKLRGERYKLEDEYEKAYAGREYGKANKLKAKIDSLRPKYKSGGYLPKYQNGGYLETDPRLSGGRAGRARPAGSFRVGNRVGGRNLLLQDPNSGMSQGLRDELTGFDRPIYLWNNPEDEGKSYWPHNEHLRKINPEWDAIHGFEARKKYYSKYGWGYPEEYGTLIGLRNPKKVAERIHSHPTIRHKGKWIQPYQGMGPIADYLDYLKHKEEGLSGKFTKKQPLTKAKSKGPVLNYKSGGYLPKYFYGGSVNYTDPPDQQTDGYDKAVKREAAETGIHWSGQEPGIISNQAQYPIISEMANWEAEADRINRAVRNRITDQGFGPADAANINVYGDTGITPEALANAGPAAQRLIDKGALLTPLSYKTGRSGFGISVPTAGAGTTGNTEGTKSELPYQTWQRIMGTPWSEGRKLTGGDYNKNLELQKKLLEGWRPGQAEPLTQAEGKDVFTPTIGVPGTSRPSADMIQAPDVATRGMSWKDLGGTGDTHNLRDIVGWKDMSLRDRLDARQQYREGRREARGPGITAQEILGGIGAFAGSVANLIMAGRTPKVPRPRLADNVKMQTDINTRPIEHELKSGSRRTFEAAKSQIGDPSKTAALAAGLSSQTNKQLGQIGMQRQEMETQLKNIEAEKNAAIDQANLGLVSQYEHEDVNRSLDIQSKYSKISQDLSNTVQGMMRDRNMSANDLMGFTMIAKALDTEGIVSANFLKQVFPLNPWAYRRMYRALEAEGKLTKDG